MILLNIVLVVYFVLEAIGKSILFSMALSNDNCFVKKLSIGKIPAWFVRVFDVNSGEIFLALFFIDWVLSFFSYLSYLFHYNLITYEHTFDDFY